MPGPGIHVYYLSVPVLANLFPVSVNLADSAKNFVKDFVSLASCERRYDEYGVCEFHLEPQSVHSRPDNDDRVLVRIASGMCTNTY